MKREELNEWLGIAANLGVILGIVFLIIEIDQSTKATVAAASDNVTVGYLELSLPIMTDSETARVFALGLYQPGSLTDEEAVQFAMYLRQLVNHHIRIRQLARSGLHSEFFEGGDIQQLARMLSTPGGQIFFEGNKDVMPQDLLSDMEPYLGQELQSDFTLGRDWSIAIE
ncbi:MAG: hypothetical protein QNJ00_11970 [Woeseiaceae bacterium]|nr:hypothetical protein [Woeseiaceae bacterium]